MRSDQLNDFIEAASLVLDLAIEPAWKDAVKGHLIVTLQLSASFADFPLPDEAEPAPVFVA